MPGRCVFARLTIRPTGQIRVEVIATVAWNQIRLTRANPPGRAGADDERRETYTAALEQFDDLFAAAASVGPASRPLPLFYAFSQAGRAIAAAYGSEQNFKTHGLTWTAGDSVLTSLVKPKPSGAFATVAEATNSARLAGATEIGALWSALPDLADTPLPDGDWPQALSIWPRQVPEGFTAIRVAVYFGFEATHGDEYAERLKFYPSAKGASLDLPPGLPVVELTPRGYGPTMTWSGLDDQGEVVRRIEDIAPEYRYMQERWLIPGLGSKVAAPSPLMIWWALLYGFSMLARYEPRLWVKALDLNASAVAVHIQDALDEALEAVPHLVAEALLRTPILNAPRVPVWGGRITGTHG